MPSDREQLRYAIQQRAADRERAFARLSRLTTTTALAGVFATVGFGGLAAVTYSGNTDTSSDPLTLDDATGGSTSAGASGGQAVPGATAASGATAAPGRPAGAPRATAAPGTTNRQPVTVNPPTVTRGRSHSSTGGSG